MPQGKGSVSILKMNTLIKNGILVDGTGKKPFHGDLMLEDGKIKEIKDHIRIPKEHFCNIIDASDKYVTPGFIDIHRHADTAVFRKDFGKLELHQGLTTIVNGNCGLSCADRKSVV